MGIKLKVVGVVLLIGDLSALVIALLGAVLLRYFGEILKGGADFQVLFLGHLPAFLWVFLIWILVLYIAGFYSTSFAIGYRLTLAQRLLPPHVIASLIAISFFYLLPYFTGVIGVKPITPRVTLFFYVFFAYFTIFGWRIFGLPLTKAAFGKGLIYFIGPAPELKELIHAFQYNIYYKGFRVTNNFDDLELAAERGLFTALVATNPYPHNETLSKKFYELIFKGIKFFDFQKFYESVFHRIPVSLVNEGWFLDNISASAARTWYDILKRLLDILIAFAFGVVSLAFYPFIVLAIKFGDGGPVFYVPKRVGRNGRVFNLIKFRTMRVDAEAKWPSKNDPRVTRVGKFLRKTSLDELPQLWNVLKGDISLVGPRPDLIDFAKILRAKIPYYDVRTLIKPGLTGWALVSQTVAGENPSSLEETETRLSYDIYYIKNRSLVLDLAIILKTIKLVLGRMGLLK